MHMILEKDAFPKVHPCTESAGTNYTFLQVGQLNFLFLFTNLSPLFQIKKSTTKSIAASTGKYRRRKKSPRV